MMGRIDNQMQLLILDLDSMIPENHLLRQIKNSVNFDFIYEKRPLFIHIQEENLLIQLL